MAVRQGEQVRLQSWVLRHALFSCSQAKLEDLLISCRISSLAAIQSELLRGSCPLPSSLSKLLEVCESQTYSPHSKFNFTALILSTQPFQEASSCCIDVWTTEALHACIEGAHPGEASCGLKEHSCSTCTARCSKGHAAWSIPYSRLTEHPLIALAARRCLRLHALSKAGCTVDGRWVRCFLEGRGDALCPVFNLLFGKVQAEISQPQQELKAGITLLNCGWALILGDESSLMFGCATSLSGSIWITLAWRLHRTFGEFWPSSKSCHTSPNPMARAAVHAWLQHVCQKRTWWFQEAEKSLLPLGVCSCFVVSS